MRIIVFISLLITSFSVLSQDNKQKKVKIEHADELEGGIHNGKEVRKLRGDVVFSQDGAKMYCDSAYQYAKENSIDAFGRVIIVQGDSMTILGNSLKYNGNTKIAKMKGNVIMKDKTMTLYTDFLDYNVGTKTAYYYDGGKIVDKDMVLTSERGRYHSPSKTMFFKDSVFLDNKDYKVWCDTLNYNTFTKTAFFLGPTNIDSKGTKLFAKHGMYNTVTGESFFENQAAINDSLYTLKGDSIHYNQKLKEGFAFGNVEMFLKKDSIYIYGETGITDDKTGISKVFGKGTLMKSVMQKDTLYLTADTLMAIKDTLGKIKRLSAWNDVQLFKSDLQGKCDSLNYNYIDSTISLYFTPILWSDGSQVTGKFLKIQLKHNNIEKMFVDENAFMVSKDTFQNFNQIKGKNMVANFDKGKIKLLDVEGNGQSVYFVLENDSVFTGMNKTLCTDMKFSFDSNRIERIKFIAKPEAKFIPPHELRDPDKFLPGYQWLIEQKPILSKMLFSDKPTESLLLEVPEELKLPEDSTNNQEQSLIDRKDN